MNRSMLCASIPLLMPLSLAMSFQDLSFDIGIGQRCVTIGDPNGTKKNVFGTQVEGAVFVDGSLDTGIPNTYNDDGIARSVGYCAPMATGSLAFKIGKNIKLSGEVHASSSDSLYVNDVFSDVADVVYYGKAVNTTSLYAGVLSTNGGRNDLQVSPKFEVELKGEWQFGEEANGATLGVALIRAQDEFTYLADVSTGNEISELQGNSSNLDVLSTEEDTYVFPGGVITDSRYRLQSADTEKYDESGYWAGVVGSTASRVTDSLSVRASVGYFMRSFDSSKGDNNGVKFLVRDTDARMSSFNVAFALNR